ncbi:MAG: hypothetical protein E6K82_12235 [Candidatus Rokuibacteriota bacterium]|nr:MAG: hypothetical protein E6K82_12235 [Candidatus Rokubacteria bacterium]
MAGRAIARELLATRTPFVVIEVDPVQEPGAPQARRRLSRLRSRKSPWGRRWPLQPGDVLIVCADHAQRQAFPKIAAEG